MSRKSYRRFGESRGAAWRRMEGELHCAPGGSVRTETSGILDAIEQKLGFVPPFFGPAADQADLLSHLWQQTESAYIDNPLPALFKEQLAALLGRFCPVPYCFVCHTCSLQPLGMRAGAILRLLESPPARDEEVDAILARLADQHGLPSHGTQLEADVFALSNVIYIGGRLAGPARTALRRVLDPRDYNHLVTFVSYNRMCHEWMAAHPEVSYEMDRRYINGGKRLIAEAPQVGEMFAGHAASWRRPQHEERDSAALFETALERAGEADRMRDLSEQRLDEVLKALTERIRRGIEETTELRQVRAEAEATSKFAQELLAIVSHDLRGPLAAILMGATILERLDLQDPRVARPLRRIFSSARRAQGLISDLLDFSLARAGGGIPIHRRRIKVDELVRHVAEELEVAHPGRTIEVESTGDCSAEWDAERIEQVLSNLLGNALVHSPGGTAVTVSVRGEEGVTISTRNVNREGPIPADVMRAMFEPFKRGVRAPTSRNRGVGLGLYIVDQIVRPHGGRIEVSSVGDSTTFTLHLPRGRHRAP
jgi:sigma-B regulation protein RsbU (phosphoserine phosphatase)